MCLWIHPCLPCWELLTVAPLEWLVFVSGRPFPLALVFDGLCHSFPWWDFLGSSCGLVRKNSEWLHAGSSFCQTHCWSTGNTCPSLTSSWKEKPSVLLRYSVVVLPQATHLVFPRLETPLNVDFQPWDNITSLGCALEFPLSWSEGGSTSPFFLSLVPNTSLSGQILLWCLLWNLHFSLHLPVYLIFVIWGLSQILYPVIHAFQKLFICIPSQEGFPRGSIDFLTFFFFKSQCLVRRLNLSPDVQRNGELFTTLLTDLAFLASWIVRKGTAKLSTGRNLVQHN